MIELLKLKKQSDNVKLKKTRTTKNLMNYFENIKENLAFHKFKKGERTEEFSRIVYILSLHVIVLIMAVLIQKEQYIPLVIFISLAFTPLGLLTSIGLIIYFIIIKYWIGVILFAFYAFLAWFSTWFSIRDIKKKLFSSKTTINPYEGMIDLHVLTWIALFLFGTAIATRGTLSIVLWATYCIVALFLIYRLYSRVRNKWCRLHYPLIIRYAQFSAIESRISKAEEREFEVQNPLIELILSAFVNFDTDKSIKLFENAQQKLTSFQDKQSFEKLMKSKNPNIDTMTLTIILTGFEKKTKTIVNGLLVRYVIAEIIANDFGNNQRLEYLFEVYVGNVD